MRQGSVDVPRNSIAWEISRSSVAQWFTCFEDVQRKKHLLRTSWLCNIQDISIDAKTVEAMIRVFSLRELFHKMLHGTLAKVAGSYRIHH